MNSAADILTMKAQEKALVFERFSEKDALEIGLSIVRTLQAEGKSGLIDVSLWDRQLFAFAMAGTSFDNADWVRRKVNVVRRFHVSSYRKALEMTDAGRVFTAAFGTDPMDYAAAGGGFPVRLKDGPVIGCVTVSGLPQREDHQTAVNAIASHLGLDPADFALD
ncbi:MAG: heme-degrading domain-containing protein [Rhizobiaceae bacterium]